MSKINEIISDFLASYSVDGAAERMPTSGLFGVTVGVVVDTDDPLQMGRLRVFCPSLNDDPKKLQYIPWSAYGSPFGGSINNSAFTRGTGNSPSSQGASHYGFWAIPELGANVLVTCIDGDPRRRVWIACLPQHQEVHTINTGRWIWESGSVDGPLTSIGEPLNPLYESIHKAFNGDTSSPEWKSRAAEYQLSAIPISEGQIPNKKKVDYLDQTNKEITDNETDEWVKEALGAHGYDWSGFKNMGSLMSSRAYGMSSPAGHSLLMDDRPWNSRTRIRSVGGHIILMDDTNERIYIATNEGNNYIEMDSNGNIDVFSSKRISFHAEQDINFTTDETFRVHAKKGIHMYSGNNTSQSNLDSAPADGEIRIQAENDFHLITNSTMRQYAFNDMLIEIGAKKCETVGENSYLQINGDFNTTVNEGDYNLTIGGNFNELIQGNTNSFTYGIAKNNSAGRMEVISFGDKIDLGGLTRATLKSVTNDVFIEAQGAGSDNNGAVVMSSPGSVVGVTSKGIYGASDKSIKMKSSEEFSAEIADVPRADPPTTPEESSGIPDCNIQTPVETEGYSGVDLAARVAYNAGFRGDDLLTITAIAGAESNYNPNAVGDTTITNATFGPSYGLWQVRSLNNHDPNASYAPDKYRDSTKLRDPAYNAKAAYEIYSTAKQRNPERRFQDWTVFQTGAYKSRIQEAKAAITTMCGGQLMEMSVDMSEAMMYGFNLPQIPSLPSLSSLSSNIDKYIPSPLSSAQTLLSVGKQNINMQAVQDVALKTLQGGMSSTVFNNIIPTINTTITSMFSLNSAIDAAIGALGGSLSIDLGSLLPIPGLDLLQNLNIDMLSELTPTMPTNFLQELAEETFYYTMETIRGKAGI